MRVQMVLRCAVVGNHDLGRYALSFRAQHGAVIQSAAERTPYGETVLLFFGDVSVFLLCYLKKKKMFF